MASNNSSDDNDNNKMKKTGYYFCLFSKLTTQMVLKWWLITSKEIKWQVKKGNEGLCSYKTCVMSRFVARIALSFDSSSVPVVGAWLSTNDYSGQ